MLSRLTRKEIERMMNVMCFTPFAYGALAWLLSKYPLQVAGEVKTIYNALLFGAFVLLLLSRPLQSLMLPSRIEPTRRRAAAACMVLATLGELMAAAGAAAVWFGASLPSYAPFFIISLLYAADFRFLRLPSILCLLPEEPEE